MMGEEFHRDKEKTSTEGSTEVMPRSRRMRFCRLLLPWKEDTSHHDAQVQG